MHARPRLLALFEEVGARASALVREHPGWPCARGCGACCRSLARVPELTRSEWELLEQTLRALPGRERASCLERARALAQTQRGQAGDQRCACPFFDAEGELCRVYQGRPLACRSYGFYAGRSHDAWCQLVAAHVEGARERLVLGNLDGVEADLSRIDGERRSLLDWLGLSASTPEVSAATNDLSAKFEQV
ncbi:MAG TPA: YkgJ family cysteine cluster protein [Polyangiales bacterium]